MASKGRPKGSKNKSNVAVEKRLDELGFDVIEFMVKLATNTLPCWLCHGKKNVYVPKNQRRVDEPERQTCPQCEGTGVDCFDNASRVKAASRLMDSVHPKLASKTVERTTRRIVVARLAHLSPEQRAVVEDEIANHPGNDPDSE